MKPRRVRRLPTTWIMLCGPGEGPVALYWAIAPHSAARPPTFRTSIAASRCVAADVVEVDVDAVRRGVAQAGQDGAVLVVERGVEPEVVHEVIDLRRRAGAADDRVAAKLGELPDERSDRAGRARHEDDVPVGEGRDVEQPRVGGEPRHPQDAEVRLCRGDRRVDRLDRRRRQDGPLAPALSRAGRSCRRPRSDPRSRRPRRPPRRRAPCRSETAGRSSCPRSCARACTGRPTSTCCGRGPHRRPGPGPSPVRGGSRWARARRRGARRARSLGRCGACLHATPMRAR